MAVGSGSPLCVLAAALLGSARLDSAGQKVIQTLPIMLRTRFRLNPRWQSPTRLRTGRGRRARHCHSGKRLRVVLRKPRIGAHNAFDLELASKYSSLQCTSRGNSTRSANPSVRQVCTYYTITFSRLAWHEMTNVLHPNHHTCDVDDICRCGPLWYTLVLACRQIEDRH